jgi:hypothetical protein
VGGTIGRVLSSPSHLEILEMASMRTIAVLLATLAALAPASASSTFIEQVAETGPIMGQPGRSSTQRIWLSANLICMEDAEAGTTSIIRPEAGSVVLVDRDSQSWSEFTLSQFSEAAEAGVAALTALGGGAEPKIEVVETGARETIGAWTANEVVATITHGPVVIESRLWLSKDTPVDMTAFRRVASLAPQGPMSELQDKLVGFEGYPVKTVTTVRMMGQEMTSTTIVKQIGPGPADPAACVVPATYKKSAAGVPDVPGAPTPPGGAARGGAR